jgi:WD40 repeat protein
MLSDYGTAIAWTPDGTRLAASSAAGEVVLYDAKTGTPSVLQPAQGQSVDALSISHDGKFLAVAGQAGTVRIWQIGGESSQALWELTYSQGWIDRLQWHPQYPELAFGFGRHVQVWDALTQTIITTLNFATSSALDLTWHPHGEHLTVSGNQSVKTWHRQHWDDDPLLRETGGASEAISWSPDGIYLASGNNDRSLLVWELGHPYPWRMQGFPGKVRQLAWSTSASTGDPPILASTSADSIIIWQQAGDPSIGWEAQVLEQYDGTVMAIAFQPNSRLLASVAEDGWVCLWHQANRLVQMLQGAPKGFSSLAWNRQGTALAAAGQQGEILVWKQPMRGKGFG